MDLIALAAARAADMAAVHAMAFEAPWDAAAIEGLLASPGVSAIGVEAGGGLVGFILLRAIAGEAEVLTLAVAPGLRRQGVGRGLMQAALVLAGAAGAERAFLEVAADNPAALALYRTLSFAPVGRRPAYYRRANGLAVDALLLSRNLPTGGA